MRRVNPALAHAFLLLFSHLAERHPLIQIDPAVGIDVGLPPQRVEDDARVHPRDAVAAKRLAKLLLRQDAVVVRVGEAELLERTAQLQLVQTADGVVDFAARRSEHRLRQILLLFLLHVAAELLRPAAVDAPPAAALAAAATLAGGAVLARRAHFAFRRLRRLEHRRRRRLVLGQGGEVAAGVGFGVDRPRRAKINALALGSRRRLPSTSAPPSHTLCSWTEKQEKLGKCRANSSG